MNGIEKIVHVIPLGHEFDRVVKPFEEVKANRVYLLTILNPSGIAHITEEMSERQQYFLNRVKKALEDKGIEVIVKHINIFSLLETLRNISRIIRFEKERGNIVYVNISGAGRLTSVAATLAAMAHGAKIYYVVASRYSKTEEEVRKHGLSICEKVEIISIANLKINLPDEMSLKILSKLCENEMGMKTDEIIKYLKELKSEGFDEDELRKVYKNRSIDERRIQQLLLNRLNRRFLDKLERDGYIIREKRGRRNTIKITEAGKYIAYMSGFLNIEENEP